jgi:hypothetical protein
LIPRGGAFGNATVDEMRVGALSYRLITPCAFAMAAEDAPFALFAAPDTFDEHTASSAPKITDKKTILLELWRHPMTRLARLARWGL